MLFDTNVLVWMGRNHSGAIDVVQADGDRATSIICYMELLDGARNKTDLLRIQMSLNLGRFAVLPLSESIGNLAAVLLEELVLSHGLDHADALIAATAIENDVPLCTANLKHFRPIKGLELKAFKP